MIRDRGNIKWTSMMLPEHVRLLRQWKEEEQYTAKPEIDEQQLEEFNEIICMAMENHQLLRFTVHEHEKLVPYTGYIHFLDPVGQAIRIVNEAGKRQMIPLEGIVKIEEQKEE
ncbi:YolD-like family protein [Bacillus sp. FJAT-42376]|uniref:YolD-like family protein n=1 Tax=Bacillus sp. FJAT-42376 TaxID=2014076 RepID=UPI000F50D9D6|nr:YolD-like family protein [Bacillus sp. FJAT-42376]AZB43448.1 YolD-like family protein [Bacillus sp. FJAT-42376]